MFLKFENPRRGRQARNFLENDPKILDLKSSSEQIIFRKLSLGASDKTVSASAISEQVSRCYINAPHELTCQILTNQSIKFGRRA